MPARAADSTVRNGVGLGAELSCQRVDGKLSSIAFSAFSQGTGASSPDECLHCQRPIGKSLVSTTLADVPVDDRCAREGLSRASTLALLQQHEDLVQQCYELREVCRIQQIRNRAQ